MQTETITYRARRWKFIPAGVVPLVITVLMIDFSFIASDPDRHSHLLTSVLLLIPILWLDAIILMKLVWPPEIDISTAGIRLKNRALLVSGAYAWNEIDGPVRATGGRGVPLIEMTVKSSGKRIRMVQRHFGATFEEMESVIKAARAGRLVQPA